MVSARIGRGSGRRLQVAVEVEAGVEPATALRFHSATRAEVAQRQHVEVVDEQPRRPALERMQHRGQLRVAAAQPHLHRHAREALLPRLGQRRAVDDRAARSEEHTSELQSLMRISYAVFCLKKKKQKTTN